MVTRVPRPSGELGTCCKASCKLESEAPSIASAMIAGNESLKDSLCASGGEPFVRNRKDLAADFQLPLTEVRRLLLKPHHR